MASNYKRKAKMNFEVQGTVTGRIKPELDVLGIEPRTRVTIELPADAAQALTEMSEGELMELSLKLGFNIISIKKVQ